MILRGEANINDGLYFLLLKQDEVKHKISNLDRPLAFNIKQLSEVVTSIKLNGFAEFKRQSLVISSYWSKTSHFQYNIDLQNPIIDVFSIADNKPNIVSLISFETAGSADHHLQLSLIFH